MNLLDANTKAMLDAGSAVMLDGKYLIISPETFQAILNGTVPVQTAEEEANDSFIQQGCKCHFCGKENDFTEYTMTIAGGYDSDHDTEVVTLEVCAGCLEKMLAAVS